MAVRVCACVLSDNKCLSTSHPPRLVRLPLWAGPLVLELVPATLIQLLFTFPQCLLFPESFALRWSACLSIRDRQTNQIRRGQTNLSGQSDRLTWREVARGKKCFILSLNWNIPGREIYWVFGKDIKLNLELEVEFTKMKQNCKNCGDSLRSYFDRTIAFTFGRLYQIFRCRWTILQKVDPSFVQCFWVSAGHVFRGGVHGVQTPPPSPELKS